VTTVVNIRDGADYDVLIARPSPREIHSPSAPTIHERKR